jgi:hypothetical protein
LNIFLININPTATNTEVMMPNHVLIAATSFSQPRHTKGMNSIKRWMAIIKNPIEIRIHDKLYFVDLVRLNATIAPINWSTIAIIKARNVIIFDSYLETKLLFSSSQFTSSQET